MPTPMSNFRSSSSAQPAEAMWNRGLFKTRVVREVDEALGEQLRLGDLQNEEKEICGSRFGCWDRPRGVVAARVGIFPDSGVVLATSILPNPPKRFTSAACSMDTMRETAMGWASTHCRTCRDFLENHFEGKSYPDSVILKSGLHDGYRFETTENYATSVDRAIEFWGDVLGNISGTAPTVLYRTTIAPAGTARHTQPNPWKMEVYYKVITEKVQLRFPDALMVDAFDLTFPWHFDNACSDGHHYGAPPGAQRWPWSEKPHQYFVDVVMLVNILLNAICPISSSNS